MATMPISLLSIIIIVLLVKKFAECNKPRVGGKIGRKIGRSLVSLSSPAPDGFSSVTTREITVFTARPGGARYPDLDTFLRKGTFKREARVNVYRVAACDTRIEIPEAEPDYARIDASQALALLRELPDPRLVYRLHLSDVPSFLDPWVQKLAGREIAHVGNATSTGVVVLYRPDRGHGKEIGVTLLHEWLHLLAFKSQWAVHRFQRANAIEPVAPLDFAPVSYGNPKKTRNYEIWSDLGERLLGYDEAIARQTALAAPIHSLILWRRVEKILRAVPRRLQSTRLAEFQARSLFMHTEVAPKTRRP